MQAYFEWEIAELSARRERSERVSDYEFARAAGRLRDREGVLEHLEDVVASGHFSLQWAGREVWFDFLRGDPDFERILSDAGLASRAPVGG